MRAAAPSVALVCMPWTSLQEPSLGLGLLRAVLGSAGVQAQVHHLQIEMLRWLKAGTYIAIANVFALNDFLFSGALNPEVSPRQLRLLRRNTGELLSAGLIDLAAVNGVDGTIERLLALRATTLPAWLDETAREIVESGATMVGFTCMFDQTIASIALAQRIKQLAPGMLVVLGGYAVRSPTAEMLVAAFPFVDAVCVGEGEPAIVGLARCSVGQATLSGIPNLVMLGSDGTPTATTPAPRVDLEQTPTPDYDDYFADLARLKAQHQVEIEVNRLPIENSRGCWWGARHHCVFCGIHDDDLQYRARTAQRVVAAMDDLSARYGIREFRFADYILPHQYHQDLVPLLISRGSPYKISCEIKANLRPEHVAGLAQAGFVAVQPGIESFSNAVLKRMDKGVSGTQNVHTLLLGKRHGLHIDYNILYGLPGDTAEDYQDMVRQLPRLMHLDAPATRVEVQITRYAPLAVKPEAFGIEATGHEPTYDLIFTDGFLADSGFDLDLFCYYFERRINTAPRLGRLLSELAERVDEWRERAELKPAQLRYWLAGETLAVEDSRGDAACTWQLSTAASRLLLTLAEPARFDASDEAFIELDQVGLVFRDGERAVALALPRDDQDERALVARFDARRKPERGVIALQLVSG